MGYGGEERHFSNRQPKAKVEWLACERTKNQVGKVVEFFYR
jgi:hypothetical protein